MSDFGTGKPGFCLPCARRIDSQSVKSWFYYFWMKCEKKQDRQTLLKTKYCPRVDAASCLFTSELSLVLIAPTHGGMARLSWPGRLVTYEVYGALQTIYRAVVASTLGWVSPRQTTSNRLLQLSFDAVNVPHQLDDFNSLCDTDFF